MCLLWISISFWSFNFSKLQEHAECVGSMNLFKKRKLRNIRNKNKINCDEIAIENSKLPNIIWEYFAFSILVSLNRPLFIIYWIFC